MSEFGHLVTPESARACQSNLPYFDGKLFVRAGAAGMVKRREASSLFVARLLGWIPTSAIFSHHLTSQMSQADRSELSHECIMFDFVKLEEHDRDRPPLCPGQSSSDAGEVDGRSL